MQRLLLVLSILGAVTVMTAQAKVPPFVEKMVESCASNFEQRCNMTRTGKTLQQWESAIDQIHDALKGALESIIKSVIKEDAENRDELVANNVASEMMLVKNQAKQLNNSDSFHSDKEREVFVIFDSAYRRWLHINIENFEEEEQPAGHKLGGMLGDLIKSVGDMYNDAYIFEFVEICSSFGHI